MASDWRRVQISSVCELIIDCVNKTAPHVEYETPYKMIRTPNIKNGRIDLTDCRYVERDTYEKWTRRATVERGDVLLTREAPMGEVGYVDFDDQVFLGQRIMQYRAEPTVLYPRYLLYAFLSPDLQNQFKMHDGSGSVVSHIRVPDCSRFEISFPSLPEQQRIVRILGSIDDKIYLNHQINQTLEQMSQAIFKSWFVNVEPFKAKMAALEAGGSEADARLAAMQAISGKSSDQLARLQVEQPEHYAELRATAELFPSAMQDNELGELPEGWETVPFSDLAKLHTRSVKPNGNSKKIWEHFSIPAFDAGKGPVLELGANIKSNKYKVDQNCVLVSKLNPHFPRIWWPEPTDQEAAICSTEFMQFVPRSPELRPFMAGMIASPPFQQGIMMRVTGSTGSRQRAQPKQVATMDVVLPPESLVLEYCRLTASMYAAQASNIKQSQALAQLRDTLLPKLLAGELTIPEAEEQVAEVADA